MAVPGGDPFAAAFNSLALTAPASRFVAVTPDDSNNLPQACRAIYVGGAGNVAITGQDDADGQKTTFAVTAGQILPVMAKRIFANGTTATGLVALY